MTNSVRTCLLNLAAWTGSDPPPGEDYVPADFVVRPLNPDLVAVRTALLGTGGDRAGANLGLARILAFLHGSSLAADVTLSDPRITYDPTAPASVWDSIGPTAVGPFPVIGWSGAPTFNAPGRAYGIWTVSTAGSGSVTVTPQSGLDGPPVTGPVELTPTGDRVWLPGTALGVVLPTATAGTWLVSLVAQPTHSFVRAADLTTPGVFRPQAGGAEARWALVWTTDPSPALRAGALALALSARVLETGGGN